MILLGFFRASGPMVFFVIKPVMFANVSLPTNGSINKSGVSLPEIPAFMAAIY